MSAQFGRWNFDGRPVAPDYIERVSEALAPYGPDSLEKYSKDGLTVVYRAFYTTKESHSEVQPHISQSGAVITWDGRLDNRKELISELRQSVAADSTDLAIVAAAYERWGEQCLPKLIGDWALSIWTPSNRSLLLAKDVIGTHSLYYWHSDSQVSWATVLDPVVRLAGRTFELEKEYVAGLLSSSYPALHLTPCAGIFSVPPSSRVLIRPGKRDVKMYWDFDPGKKIRYRTDPEYEEHFRTVFAQAVQRKLRSDRPVLSELSGGRDSSSIVCMGDVLIGSGRADCPRLDTISCYDDSEPNWNERPFFEKVEQKRGRTGWHVNVACPAPEEKSAPEPSSQLVNRFPTPGSDGRTGSDLRKCLAAQGNRVVLSGIGGDEVMGGVPTPIPEFQNLIATGRIRILAHQLKVWALELRKPWIHLFWEAARDFLPPALVGVPKHLRPPAWLQSGFVRQYRAALTGYPTRTKLFGSLPSFQANTGTLDHVRKQLARSAPPFDPPVDRRYPFLDRDLMEFLFAIPREQHVRPTQRRSLHRRALVGIVPDEILNRKTKAFVSRAPLAAISRDWAFLMEVTQDMISSSLGIVDRERLHAELQKGRAGEEIPILTLNSALFVDGWLKNLQASGYVNLGAQKTTNLAWQASVQG